MKNYLILINIITLIILSIATTSSASTMSSTDNRFAVDAPAKQAAVMSISVSLPVQTIKAEKIELGEQGDNASRWREIALRLRLESAQLRLESAHHKATGAALEAALIDSLAPEVVSSDFSPMGENDEPDVAAPVRRTDKDVRNEVEVGFLKRELRDARRRAAETDQLAEEIHRIDERNQWIAGIAQSATQSMRDFADLRDVVGRVANDAVHSVMATEARISAAIAAGMTAYAAKLSVLLLGVLLLIGWAYRRIGKAGHSGAVCDTDKVADADDDASSRQAALAHEREEYMAYKDAQYLALRDMGIRQGACVVSRKLRIEVWGGDAAHTTQLGEWQSAIHKDEYGNFIIAPATLSSMVQVGVGLAPSTLREMELAIESCRDDLAIARSIQILRHIHQLPPLPS